jgi:hypothetical protein
VNSATKFFGMSAFRLSTMSSAAARFSSDAGASCVSDFGPLWLPLGATSWVIPG